MTRVLSLVEGSTERNFGQRVLATHLGFMGVEYRPRVIGKPGRKGGVGSWDRARNEIVALIRQEPSSIVTTMFDLYALPMSWPGREEAKQKRLKNAEAVALIEARIEEAVRAQLTAVSFEVRFIPYLSQHEFEALLFSDPATLAAVAQLPNLASAFHAILTECGECEKINDHPDTAPSKRILRLVPSYVKTVDGIAAAERIGLAQLRACCPHFSLWLGKLEQLGDAGPIQAA